MLLALLLVPALAGLLAFLTGGRGFRRGLLLAVAATHLGLTTSLCLAPPSFDPGAWLALDGPGRLFLVTTSLIFLASSVYALGYLRRIPPGAQEDLFEEGGLFTNAPNAVFVGCLLLFLATMTLVAASQQLGLLWIAIEATTLASAPLIYYHRHHRSLEATWKYLLICSVGIALALLGNFFLIVAGAGSNLQLSRLLQSSYDPTWLRLAFILLVVGYGTKMGLAPLHTWLPDTHSEAPSLVSALLSGALLNCAYLGILRALQVCQAGGEGPFARQVLMGFGLLSMAVGAAFILNQPDFKRLLAYSSVKNMGILALGAGLGGAALWGALWHALNHSLVKAAMFLTAGNLMEAYKTRSVAEVRGALRRVPGSGTLWLAGGLALAGAPPFALFLSELLVLKGALDGGHSLLAALYLTLLSLTFVGLVTALLAMTRGRPEPAAARQGLHDPQTWKRPVPEEAGPRSESWLDVGPPAALLVLLLLLGLGLPGPVRSLLESAAATLGGR